MSTLNKKILFLLGAIMAVAGFAGIVYGNKSEEVQGRRIGLVTDLGGIGDGSFNQSAWEGIQEFVKDNGTWQASYLETAQDADILPNLGAAASVNDIVVVPGFKFSDAIGAAADQYPDTQFILIDAEPADGARDNVVSYLSKEEQGGYLAGVAAATNTKSDTLGFIGGIPVPAVQNFLVGYIQGARSINPEIKIDVQYANSFTDATIGKQKASAMYASGIDTIFTAGGGVNFGVIEEAKALTSSGQKVWTIGVDRDQYGDGLMGDDVSVVLTSAEKKVGAIVVSALEKINSGEESLEPVVVLDFESGAVGLPDTNPNFTDEVNEAVKSASEDILNGKVIENMFNFENVSQAGIY